MQLCYIFKTREQLKKAFEVLKADGTVLMQVKSLPWSDCAAEVVDRFGVRWYLSLPQHQPGEDFNAEDCPYEG